MTLARRRLGACAFVIFAFASTGQGAETVATLPAPINRFVDAINRHDTPSFLAFFPSDGRVDDWGRAYVGHDTIKAWSDREFIGADVTLTITKVEAAAHEFVVTATVGGKGFNGPSKFVLVVDGEQIQEMRITAD